MKFATHKTLNPGKCLPEFQRRCVDVLERAWQLFSKAAEVFFDKTANS